METNLYIVTGTDQGPRRGACGAHRRGPGKRAHRASRARPDGACRRLALEADLADSQALARACERAAAKIRGKRYAKAVLINNAGVVSPSARSTRSTPRARAQPRGEPARADAAHALVPRATAR
jgi:NAD(P)-dependent dehydrogenase (short-subunit alcohol dehydrogenase family)